MRRDDDQDYFMIRARRERELAEKSPVRSAAKVHAALASDYERGIGPLIDLLTDRLLRERPRASKQCGRASA